MSFRFSSLGAHDRAEAPDVRIVAKPAIVVKPGLQPFPLLSQVRPAEETQLWVHIPHGGWKNGYRSDIVVSPVPYQTKTPLILPVRGRVPSYFTDFRRLPRAKPIIVKTGQVDTGDIVESIRR